jgi:hypothetical protein
MTDDDDDDDDDDDVRLLMVMMIIYFVIFLYPFYSLSLFPLLIEFMTRYLQQMQVNIGIA